MIRTLNNTIKQDREKYKVPRSAQECLPIRRIWNDGIFQVGNKFSKCIRCRFVKHIGQRSLKGSTS